MLIDLHSPSERATMPRSAGRHAPVPSGRYRRRKRTRAAERRGQRSIYRTGKATRVRRRKGAGVPHRTGEAKSGRARVTLRGWLELDLLLQQDRDGAGAVRGVHDGEVELAVAVEVCDRESRRARPDRVRRTGGGRECSIAIPKKKC